MNICFKTSTTSPLKVMSSKNSLKLNPLKIKAISRSDRTWRSKKTKMLVGNLPRRRNQKEPVQSRKRRSFIKNVWNKFSNQVNLSIRITTILQKAKMRSTENFQKRNNSKEIDNRPRIQGEEESSLIRLYKIR